MRLEVVILRSRATEPELFAKRRSVERPQTLFVDPLARFLRRGDVVVKTSSLVCRCALSLASGAVISLDEMADWEFTARRDGGPEWAREQIRFAMIEARATLSALGYVTASVYGRGFSAKPLPMMDDAPRLELVEG